MPKLRLSDAIMLNGVSKPQGFGFKFIDSVDTPCAIGGALQAVGKQITNNSGPDNYRAFKAEWPWTEQYVSDMLLGGDHWTVAEAIWRLNDKYRWTRQQIAEWVARIEPQEPEQTTCDATVVRHCEDSGELCGKKAVKGGYLCAEHEAEVSR